VETSQGSVEVLGTKFNVIAMSDYFEVHCFEGKVKVTSAENSTILTHGDVVRFYENKSENWEENDTQIPLWITGESNFKSAPLQFVLAQFQNQYNYEIKYPEDIKSIKFTGSFTHKNLDIALKSICIPLHLKSTKPNTKTIELSE
jgi:transmembrane sensor